MIKTRTQALLPVLFVFSSLLISCDGEDVNSNVSFSSSTMMISSNDLSPTTVSLDITPPAPEDSFIELIVTGADYGQLFTTEPALAQGEIDVVVSQGSTTASFTIIPEEEIGFGDVELAFEIIAVGPGLSTNEFDGRFLDFTILNEREQVQIPLSEDFNVCGAEGTEEFPPAGWTEWVVAQNSFETSNWACYTGQGVLGIQINGFTPDAEGSGEDYSEVWFISPPVDLLEQDNPELSFDVDRRFEAQIDPNTLTYGIQIATDFDGSNFETANWEVYQIGLDAMTANDPGADDIANTGPLDLSAYAGENISIAYIYRAADAYFGATILRIANVRVE